MSLLLSSALFPTLSSAATYTSYTGTFGADNDEQFFSLALGGAGAAVSIRTWSYGGGTNAGGVAIPSGGFAPELTVFDSAGNEVAIDATGGTVPNCNGRTIDPSTGFCFDAFIYDSSRPPLTLGAGTYTISLTQQGNDPLGLLSDGFSQDAAHGDDPTFTGDNVGLTGQMFIDPGNFSQRTNQWAVDVGVTPVSSVPEPGPAPVLLVGFLAMALIHIRNTRRRKAHLGKSIIG